MTITLAGIGLLQILVLVGLIASAVFYLIELHSAAQFFRPRRLVASPYRPAVTVLKPLKGLDIELYENLTTLCQQRYSAPLQLLFGVADPHDPAIGAVRQLQREFPRLDIELVIDHRVYGTNYKVSNLHNMYRRAKHDVIILADSDIRVSPNWVSRVVEPLQDRRAGLVTCIYRAVNTGGLPTLIESLFVNTDFAALVMLARKVEKSSYAFGATIAMRRAVLDEIGGFLPIVNLLADDYEIGYRISHPGYRLALRPEVVDTCWPSAPAPPRPSAPVGAHLSDQPPRRLFRQHPDPRDVLGGGEPALQRLQPAELRRQRRGDRAALLGGRAPRLDAPGDRPDRAAVSARRPQGPLSHLRMVRRLPRQRGRMERSPLPGAADRRDGRPQPIGTADHRYRVRAAEAAERHVSGTR
jgi:cellulose synthase/poly-beta-1,6-N-acetylglucosamine synthase-like glycosyltransferase